METQFYRQKPIENFIVDFYAPTVKIVIEVDGGQHFEVGHEIKDRERDEKLESLGLTVLRFDNAAINTNLDGVLEQVYDFIADKKSL